MLPDVSSEEAPFVEGVMSFLGSPSTSTLAKKQLAAFVEPVAIHSTAENYAQDMDRRIDLIKQLQKRVHAFHPELNFNLMQVAFLLQVDLMELSDYVEEDNMTDIMQILKSVEAFLKACLGRTSYLDKHLAKESKRELSHSEDSNARRAKGDAGDVIAAGISAALPSETEDKRGTKERDKAVERDGNMCIFTRAGYPDGAHIIPHTINKIKKHATNARAALAGLLLSYRKDLWKGVKPLLFEKDFNGELVLGCSDKAFNILAMNTHVRRCFDRAVFGLKPIMLPQRTSPADENIEFICVEWRYLPKQLSDAFRNEGRNHLRNNPTTSRPVAKCEFNLDSSGLCEFLTDHLQRPLGDSDCLGDGLPCIYHPSGRRFESGMRFDIPAYKEDAEKTRWLLELSWLALRVASMSGAAEAIDYLRDQPPEDWEEAFQAAFERQISMMDALTEWGRKAELEGAESELDQTIDDGAMAESAAIGEGIDTGSTRMDTGNDNGEDSQNEEVDDGQGPPRKLDEAGTGSPTEPTTTVQSTGGEAGPDVVTPQQENDGSEAGTEL